MDEELEAFIEEYNVWEAECDAEYDELMASKKGSITSKRKRTKKTKTKEVVEV